jgi:hypothetical protein
MQIFLGHTSGKTSALEAGRSESSENATTETQKKSAYQLTRIVVVN